METVEDNIYDYPVYYDLIFGSDWPFFFLWSCLCDRYLTTISTFEQHHIGLITGEDGSDLALLSFTFDQLGHSLDYTDVRTLLNIQLAKAQKHCNHNLS